MTCRHVEYKDDGKGLKHCWWRLRELLVDRVDAQQSWLVSCIKDDTNSFGTSHDDKMLPPTHCLNMTFGNDESRYEEVKGSDFRW